MVCEASSLVYRPIAGWGEAPSQGDYVTMVQWWLGAARPARTAALELEPIFYASRKLFYFS
jgi:hypothetical protein